MLWPTSAELSLKSLFLRLWHIHYGRTASSLATAKLTLSYSYPQDARILTQRRPSVCSLYDALSVFRITQVYTPYAHLDLEPGLIACLSDIYCLIRRNKYDFHQIRTSKANIDDPQAMAWSRQVMYAEVTHSIQVEQSQKRLVQRICSRQRSI